jgi:hypothetical protein
MRDLSNATVSARERRNRFRELTIQMDEVLTEIKEDTIVDTIARIVENPAEELDLPPLSKDRNVQAKQIEADAEIEKGLQETTDKLKGRLTAMKDALKGLPDRPEFKPLHAVEAIFVYSGHFVPAWIGAVAIDLLPLILLIFMVIAERNLQHKSPRNAGGHMTDATVYAGHVSSRVDAIPTEDGEGNSSLLVLQRQGAPLTASPDMTADRVHFAVTAPQIVAPAASFVIDVWAYMARQRRNMIERAREEASGEAIRIKSKGPVHVARGMTLTVMLRVDHLILHDAEDTILWEGEIGNASFPATVPADAHEGARQGTALVYVNGLRIARITFSILVGRRASSVGFISAIAEGHRKAFASYHHDDRNAVLARVQGILKVAPHLDVFLDVLKLRSGEDWEKALWQVIPKSDVFYLFWSRNAASSEWVEREWRCALDSRGLDFIDPVPLIDPEKVPPPLELSSKHFNDWVLAFMRTQSDDESASKRSN